MSSGFITETEAIDIRKKRQEDWERVRNASDPVERPEEPYDSRCLYERLQEQKQKKDLEYEEAHKLKNMIKGLDDDEIDFLDLVDQSKLAADRKKSQEEEQELTDYRNRVATLQEKEQDKKLEGVTANKPKLKPSIMQNNKPSQLKLLKGAVVKKTVPNNPTKRKVSESTSDEDNLQDDSKKLKDDDENTSKSKAEQTAVGGLQCVAILPGLGNYSNSSSGEDTTDSDSDDSENRCTIKLDLLGRPILPKDVGGS